MNKGLITYAVFCMVFLWAAWYGGQPEETSTPKVDVEIETTHTEPLEAPQGVYVELIEDDALIDGRIDDFVRSYEGNKYTGNYLNALRVACETEEDVKKVLSIGLAETGMGRDVDMNSNFYGWYPNMNRDFDPSYEEMATIMCNAVEGPYKNLPSLDSFSWYVRGKPYDQLTEAQKEGVQAEQGRFHWAMNQMN